MFWSGKTAIDGLSGSASTGSLSVGEAVSIPSALASRTQPPEAAWGNMLSTARNFIESSVWMSIFPGLAIMFAVLGFNFLGDGLRDVLDPRLGGVADEIVVKSK